MNPAIVKMAKAVYLGTPFPFLRKLYFKAFCFLVRGKRVTSEVDGMRFDLDLGEGIDVALFLNRFEPGVTAAIERLCRPGWTVLDIGANIGAHCLRFSRIVGPGGMVHAFEPTEYAYGKLRRNLSLNDASNVRACRIALSDAREDAREVSIKSSWRTDGKGSDMSQRVDFVRLDDWAAKQSLDRLDLVKLDVDGNEYAVVAGGVETLRRFRPLMLLEVGAWHFEQDSRNPLRVLSGIGYRFRDQSTGRPFPDLDAIRRLLPEHDEKMSFSINVLASADSPGAE